jgi:hypothetical protein
MWFEHGLSKVFDLVGGALVTTSIFQPSPIPSKILLMGDVYDNKKSWKFNEKKLMASWSTMV